MEERKKSDMFNAPQLPTDNIYKFMAFSGLAILIAVVYYEVSYQRDSNSNYSALLQKSFKFGRQIDRINSEIGNSNKRGTINDSIVNFEGQNFGLPISTWEGPHQHEILREYLSSRLSISSQAERDMKMISLLDEWLEVDKKIRSMDSIRDELLVTLGSDSVYRAIVLKRENKFITVFLCIGVLLLGSGLFLWYQKRQKFEDRIINAEANKNSSYTPKNGVASESGK